MLRAWNKLLSWLRWLRKQTVRPVAPWELRRPVPFFWVIEYTKRGWPHLHVILLWRERIHIPTVQRLWDKYGLGIVVDVRNRNWAHSKPVALATYLSKYLGKSLGQKGRTGMRRWSSSRSFLPVRERDPWVGRTGWSQGSVELHREERVEAGARIDDFFRGFRWDAAGTPIPISAFTSTVWDALRHIHGGPPAPPVEYMYPGLPFAERLELRPGRLIDTGDGPPLFIPATPYRSRQ